MGADERALTSPDKDMTDDRFLVREAIHLEIIESRAVNVLLLPISFSLVREIRNGSDCIFRRRRRREFTITTCVNVISDRI